PPPTRLRFRRRHRRAGRERICRAGTGPVRAENRSSPTIPRKASRSFPARPAVILSGARAIPPGRASTTNGAKGKKPMWRQVATAAVIAALGLGAQAQQFQPSTPRPDFDTVVIKTTDLGHRTYMLEGEGGNIVVAVADDGVIMVDDQFEPLHDKIKAAVAKITPLPIRYLLLTHFHRDHTGGNEDFAKDGAIIVAQDNVKARLASGTQNGLTGNVVPPAPKDALPKQ